MDELTIGGKRYISARRAAREHRYHSDYIGQLVRAGKVVGQKVGRSWYVEEDSLLKYFNGEAPQAPVSLTAVAEVEAQTENTTEPVVEEKIEAEEIPEIAPQVEKTSVHSISLRITKKEEEKANEEKKEQEQDQQEEKEEREEEFVNTSSRGLVYIPDESTEQETPVPAKETTSTVMPIQNHSSQRAHKRSFVPVIVLFVFGLVIFGASIFVGEHLTAVTGVEGQTAASNFIFE
jgi:hypothetical protein